MGLRQKIQFCAAHDGTRLAYATTGGGTPLVKVGNWLSHLDYDLENPVWGHLLAALSRDHTVLRYDQRGTGLSDWNVDDISFDAWVHDLGTVLDAAGIKRAPLLCISQGVPVAVAYATRHPERVSQLILHGGYARGRCKRGDPMAVVEAETIAKLAELGWGRNDPAFRQFFTSQFLPNGTAEQHRWFNELARLSTSPANAARMIRAFDQIDVSDLLAQVQCPTLVLHAHGDLRVPFAEGRYIAGQIESARFVPLDTVHHLVLEQDRAWPRWLEEVRDFLRVARTPGDQGTEFAALTPRERELIELIAQGRDNSQIAATLSLSEKTVRNHITNIFAKLEVESRAQAIVRAREAGFGRQTQP